VDTPARELLLRTEAADRPGPCFAVVVSFQDENDAAQHRMQPEFGV
jgi:hypothetical protein